MKMRKIFWTLVVCAALVLSYLAGVAWRPKKVIAAAPPAPQAATDVSCAIPKSFGTLRGGIGPSMLIFEDPSGTIHIVELADSSQAAYGIVKWCTTATRN
jgi:hypothetical protein